MKDIEKTKEMLGRVRDAFYKIKHERQLLHTQFNMVAILIVAEYVRTSVSFRVELHRRIDYAKTVKLREYFDMDTKWRHTGEVRVDKMTKWELAETHVLLSIESALETALAIYVRES